MTAISSFATFILGTKETLNALNLMVHGNGGDKQYVAKVLGGSLVELICIWSELPC